MHSLLKRVTASVPLLVTVIIHVVLVVIAGYFVTEQIIGGKKTFEASNLSESSPAMKQVEHRLQVARQGGGSASSSPLSASRIFSTAENALQLPAMPELPSVGGSSLGGMGFGKGMGGVGGGTGYATGTGIGGAGSLGRGFMSMSFLGVTNQRSSKVVFVVDIGTGLMDIRKGGFRAFEILRHEMSRLVSTLPPSHSFNVVFFDGRSIRLFARELKPATVANKTEFFDWIKPINSSLSTLGTSSIPSASPYWSFKRKEELKLDPEYGPSPWIQALHAALEQKPDTVFVITGSSSAGQIRFSEERIARARKARADRLAQLKAQGVDFAAINSARSKAISKLMSEFNEINRQLVAKKRDPFIIQNYRRLLDADMKAAIRKAGFNPPQLDYTGWTGKDGKPIWDNFSNNVRTSENAEFKDVLEHVSKLQYGLLSEKASINLFLFVGPGETAGAAQKNLTTLASRNGGRFSLLTTKRLEELSRRAEEEANRR